MWRQANPATYELHGMSSIHVPSEYLHTKSLITGNCELLAFQDVWFTDIRGFRCMGIGMGRCTSLFNNCWVNYKCLLILYYYIFWYQNSNIYWSNEKLCDWNFQSKSPKLPNLIYTSCTDLVQGGYRYSKFLCQQFLETWIYTTTSYRLRCTQTSSFFKTLIKHKLRRKHSFFLLTHMLQSQNINVQSLLDISLLAAACKTVSCSFWYRHA